ncbi:MAG TPA: SUMF1/EgtB/PvdO family nonheme iron enzyme [Terriglobales bacterium]|nr:SUMF1/EgtB/PvdO family nonheme iron enzyme [Terriglobales bacterium]
MLAAISQDGASAAAADELNGSSEAKSNRTPGSWQWTEDCYADTYANTPTDGRANETGKGCLRVDRGGSWLYHAWLLRPATRERNPADYRDAIMGFRPARTLAPEDPSQQHDAIRRDAQKILKKLAEK